MEKQNHLDDIELAKLKEEELAELIDQEDKEDEDERSDKKTDDVPSSAGDGKTTFADTDEEKKEGD